MNYKWQQVKEIFTAALRENAGNRSQFILRQCGENKQLLREVESLLESYKSADLFLEAPAVAEAAEDFAVETDKLKDGDFLNHYRIINKIGQGGMGEVYLAQDTKLDRKVAIKILGDYLGNNKTNLRRFITEAKTASALSHPNIVVIHEIDEKDGLNYIVSEYIEGLTLTGILQHRKLSLSQICDISIQVCKALTAAHTVGIIHRDIKTDNVMVRDDGIVKVLDFGLAKLIEKDKKKTDLNEKIREFMTTRAGMIMGTVSYMSPEQARGKEVDARTDIWSFGVLLYQLLSRKLPFQGDTTSDIMASILKSEPLPMTENAPNVPKKLEWIVFKALNKNPDERFQTINEILEELKSFRRGLEYGGKTEPFNFRASEEFEQDKVTNFKENKATVENTNSNQKYSFVSQTFSRIRDYSPIPLYTLLVCAILVIGGYLGWSKLGSFFTKTDSFQNMKLTKLTFDGLAMKWMTVSPDGKYIAYVLQNDDFPKLMIRQTATAGIAELISASDVNYDGLSFSPDSNFVYYISRKKTSIGELFKIPVLGGTPQKVLDKVTSTVTFSPDGTKMAFVRDFKTIMIADSNGDSEKVLAPSQPSEFRGSLDWSPDGKTIITSSFLNTENKFYLVEISVADGTERRLPTPAWLTLTSLRWIADGSGLMITARDKETKFSQIWKVSYPSGEVRRITNDFSAYFDLNLPHDKKSIYAVKTERAFNLWLSPVGSPQSAKKITTNEGRDEGMSGIQWLRDGKILYSVRTTANLELWMINADGSNDHPIVADQYSNFFPAISSDGKHIAYTSDRLSNLNLWQVDTDGKNLTQLTDFPDTESRANYSPEGNFLLYENRSSDNKLTIWKLNLQNGSHIQLTEHMTSQPIISPDGKYFACKYGLATPESPVKLAIFPIEGGKPIKVLDLPKVVRSINRWSPDGKSILYLQKDAQALNVWSQSLDMSSPKQLTFFDSGEIGSFDISPDGKTLVLGYGNESSDIVMIKDFD